MRLGGHLFEEYKDPDEWAAAIRALGYRASYCPVLTDENSVEVAAYREAASKADIVIAEVGAWSPNLISPDDQIRTESIRYCKEMLALAEEIGANCCVSIAGSRGTKKNSPHRDNFSADTFQLIVDTVREIIDAVKPRHTFYTLETMPWVFPYNVDSYVDLIRAIDRKSFAVHFDPVNMITSPYLYYHNADLIKDFFRKLGAYIKCCHAKDISLSGDFTVHLSETRPGLGGLDFRTFLSELDLAGKDIPLMMEHLPTMEEYKLAADYIRSL